jgi:comEA protein
MFSSLQEKFGFSKNEIIVVLLLCLAFLIGVGFQWFKKSASSDQDQQFDYREIEKEFLELSRRDSLERATRQDSTREEKRKTLAPRSININTATKEELLVLPGIGEQYADRIILSREDSGKFQTIEEIMRVRGIGKKTLEKIRPYITVGTELRSK